MKKFKKLVSSLLVCLMLALPMLTLTACNDDDTTTPTTSTPTTEASPTTTPETTETTEDTTKVVLSKENAEWTYFEAFRNSSLSTERKSTYTEYYHSPTTGLFEKDGECQVVLKNNTYNIKCDDEISWLKDEKYYTVQDKKYYEDYTSINYLDPLEYDTTEFLKFTRWGGEIELVFLGGEIENDTTTIYFNALETDGATYTHRLAVEIKNELITSVKLFSYDHLGNEGTVYCELTLSYENVEFLTTLPSDLDTYTLSSTAS